MLHNLDREALAKVDDNACGRKICASDIVSLEHCAEWLLGSFADAPLAVLAYSLHCAWVLKLEKVGPNSYIGPYFWRGS